MMPPPVPLPELTVKLLVKVKLENVGELPVPTL
jgi:hypothetical protein